MYSFKPFGDQRHQRSMTDMFKTTFRNTLQSDGPHYRGNMSPYNVKHALVDPSHTFTHPTTHKTRKAMDFTKYDWKRGTDKTSRNLQHIKRETFDIHGKMILRLPEERDYFGEEGDPVTTFHETLRSNKDFFKKKPYEKIDSGKFGKQNYLTAPKNPVGVASHKVYYT